MSRRSYSRHAALPVHAISPQAVLPNHGAHAAAECSSAPLVVTAERPHELLIGSGRLRLHLRTHPNKTIPAILVPSLSIEDIATLQQLEESSPPLPSSLVASAAILRRAGFPLAQLATVLPGVARLADASLLIGLAMADPYLVSAVDRGQISMRHARLLVSKPLRDQRAWAEKCVAGGRAMSSRKLEAALRNDVATHDSNIEELTERLRTALGTRIGLRWNEATQKTTFLIPWYTVEDLQNVMQKLGNAPPIDAQLPSRERTMVIELDGTAEVGALVEHLLADGF